MNPTPEQLTACLRELGVVSVQGQCRFPCPFCQEGEEDAEKFKGTVTCGSRRLLVAHCYKCGVDREGSRSWWSALCRLHPSLIEVAVQVDPGVARRLWSTAACSPLHDSLPPAADPDTLNAVYDHLLHLLDLRERHGRWLDKRGLDSTVAFALGYRSTPSTADCELAAQKLWLEWGFKLREVPGFGSVFGDQTRLLLRTDAVVVPCRDHAGRITALKQRMLDGKGARMRLVSSAPVGGPRALNGVHFPLGVGGGRWKRVWVTEGERKADVFWQRRGEAVVAIPGCGSWRKALAAVESVADPDAEVVVALDEDDAGRKTQRTLAGELARTRTTYRANWIWGKGLDDAVVKGSEIELSLVPAPQGANSPLSSTPQPEPQPWTPDQPSPVLRDSQIVPWLRGRGPVLRSRLRAFPITVSQLIKSGQLRMRFTSAGQTVEAVDDAG